jgi:FkbM family methyltransferase
MISYAQNREDVLLSRVFRDQRQGFYVDVGANDPTVYSVTRHFYDLGWHGINIEPGLIFERLQQERPRDVNLNVAVSDVSGPVTFYEFPDFPGSSTLDPAQLEHIQEFTSRCVPRTVQARPLREILEQYAPGTIDFLSVDVETHERQVLVSNDWERFRPRVLLIEATLPNSTVHNHESWENTLVAAGYVFAFFDGLNRFYVRKEDAELLQAFAVPVNVLDRYELAETHRFRAQADQLRAELEQAQTQLRLHEADRQHLLGEAERLHRDIKHIDGVAEQLRADRDRLLGEAVQLHRDIRNIDGVARVREAECQRLVGEAQQLHQAIKDLDGVAQLRGAESEQLRQELRRVEAERNRLAAEVERLGKEVQHLDAAVAQGQAECLRLRAKSQRDEDQLERLHLELEYFAGVARLSEQDRASLASASQQREALVAQLTAEAERFRLELENARDVARRWEQECAHLHGELARLGQIHAALTQGTGARSLRLGLHVARGVHSAVRRLRRLAGIRMPGGPPTPAPTGPAPAGTPDTSKEGVPVMTALKQRIRACLGVPRKLARWLLRPAAVRVRGFLLGPVLPHLEAVPRLCALLDQHGAVLSQLQGQQGAAQEQFRHLTQQLVHLEEQHQAVQRGLGQVEQALGAVQAQQTHMHNQMQGEKGVLREAEQMMLAMLKATQFTRSEREEWEGAPRIYRKAEGA